MSVIDSFGSLHAELARFRRDNRWMFRGQASAEWLLVPKAGREPYKRRNDLDLLSAWSRRAAEFLSPLPANIWERMALAQHHGLPTRLLDWSYNPLVAAFFACAEAPDSDGVIYCFRAEDRVNSEVAQPEKLKRVMKYRPVVVASRIARQSGLFTIHPDPETPLEDAIGKKDDIEFILIAANYKRDLIFELNQYGVNRLTLMGDLDGLSSHMRWAVENSEYWSGGAIAESDSA